MMLKVLLITTTVLVAAVAMAAPDAPSTISDGSYSTDEQSHVASLESSTVATANPTTANPTAAPTAVPSFCGTTQIGEGDEATFVSLKDYAIEGPVTVTGNNSEIFTVSPCTEAKMPNCSAAPLGFAAQTVDGVCTTVFNTFASGYVAVNSSVSLSRATFNAVYTSVDSKTLTVVLHCDSEASGLVGDVTGTAEAQVLTIGSFKLCAEKKQANVAIPSDSCSVDFTKYGQSYKASLSDFGNKNVTINGEPVEINPCGLTDFTTSSEFMGCKTSGYMAYMNGAECVVLDQKVSFYDPNTQFFNTTYSVSAATAALTSAPAPAPAAMFDVDSSSGRVIIVQCGSTDSTEGVLTGNTVTYTSTGACGEESPATAPSAEPSGMSTGAIVGIVIGLLALVVIVLVVCRWKRTKGEEEGEYERV